MVSYLASLFTVEELKAFIEPLREKKRELESKIITQNNLEDEINDNVPSQEEIEGFSKECVELLKNLNFQAKRGIILDTVDKIIGTKNELQVYGYIPIKSYVELKTNDRNRRTTKCWKINTF